MLSGRDLLGAAQTGTGKTAGFALPLLQRLAERPRTTAARALIVTPTRELAAQVHEDVRTYGKHLALRTAVIFGGVAMQPQIDALRRGVDIVVATPGRLLDHARQKTVDLRHIEILVLDEADRMLDMGFIPEVERIVGLLPRIRQTLFFSATMDKEIRKLADKFLMNPREIAVSAPATAATTVQQGMVTVRQADKREALRRLLRERKVDNAFIFCNRKKDVGILYRSLQRHGFSVGALHGDMDQQSRMATLDAFRNGEIAFLAASDVAAATSARPRVTADTSVNETIARFPSTAEVFVQYGPLYEARPGQLYLASPLNVAASAVEGRIVAYREGMFGPTAASEGG